MGAQVIPGYEADDIIAMYATDLGPTDCVVMSIDKDLKQIPGDHYDFVSDSYETICEHEARQNFWSQALIGDSTDDIPGLNGVGPVTAQKILSELERESERASRTNMPMCLLMVRPSGLAEIEEEFGNLGIDRLVAGLARSEEHTSELQSHSDLVCRLLLEKKKKQSGTISPGMQPIGR